MKRGWDYKLISGKNLTVQLVMCFVPLIFAFWVATVVPDAVPPLAFAFSWAVVAVIYLSYYAHVKRTDLDAFTEGHAEATLQYNRTTAIINNLADAIIATDEKGNIQLSNAAALSLLDTNEALTGKDIDEAIHLTSENDKPIKLSKLLGEATTTVSRDDVNMMLGEEVVHISLIYTPIRGTDTIGNNAQKGYILIMRDITRQKSLEEQRDEFISVVSHELRTPITIAEGALSNVQLMNERGIATGAQLTDGIKMAHDQVLFLASMINDLSTLSRAERGVMADKAVLDIEPFIHGIYNQYQAEAHKKGLHFNLDLQPQLGQVEASELYLRELIQNIVTNAIKYTKQGSVTLITHKKDGQLLFAVKDTGIGISKSDQKRIFEKFFRSEDYRTRETNGTGLGLYVARKLSHLIGTTIELESRLNHGSTFSFTLPQYKK
jgi:two-component system sensor histidine kinase VicK